MRFTATLAALTLTALSAFAAHRTSRTTINDRSEMTYDFRAGSQLTVETFNGAIRVRSGEEGRVRVVTTKYVRTDEDVDARAAMAALNVEVTREGNGLTLRAPHPPRDRETETGVTFEITLPRSADLKLETTNGAIEVEDVRGDDRLHTTNGHITVERGSGSVDAETTNGAIRVALEEVTPNRPLRFLTTNGSISLDLPSSLAADVEASTTNGSIRSDLPILANSVEGRRLAGKLNGGGTELRARTTNGSITIR